MCLLLWASSKKSLAIHAVHGCIYVLQVLCIVFYRINTVCVTSNQWTEKRQIENRPCDRLLQNLRELFCFHANLDEKIGTTVTNERPQPGVLIIKVKGRNSNNNNNNNKKTLFTQC